MKICVKADGVNLNLALPTALLCGRTVVKIANTVGRKYAADTLKDIPPEALEALCAEIRRVKKKYGAWELVDVETASGECVKIVL